MEGLGARNTTLRKAPPQDYYTENARSAHVSHSNGAMVVSLTKEVDE